MMTAKIFQNGNSQAVRLPKECRFGESEVIARKLGGIVLLIPKSEQAGWQALLSGIDLFSEDFMEEGRGTSVVEERASL